MTTRELCERVRQCGLACSPRRTYRLSPDLPLKLVSRGFLPPPERRRGRRGDDWSASHVHHLAVYMALRHGRLWGRRFAFTYWRRTGRAEEQAREFLQQLIPAFAMFANWFSVVAGFLNQAGLGSSQGASLDTFLKAAAEYNSLISSFSKESSRDDVAQQTADQLSKLFDEKLQNPDRPVGGPNVERLVSLVSDFIRSGSEVVAHYLAPLFLRNLVTGVSPATFEAIRRDARAIYACMLRNRIMRTQLGPVIRDTLLPRFARTSYRGMRKNAFWLLYSKENELIPESWIGLLVLAYLVVAKFTYDRSGREGVLALRRAIHKRSKEKEGAVVTRDS